MTKVQRLSRRRHQIAALLLGWAMGLAGCYDPKIGDGVFRCAAGQRCPRGFFCHPDDNLCWLTRTGSSPKPDGAARPDGPSDHVDGGDAGDRDGRPIDADAATDQASTDSDVPDMAMPQDRAADRADVIDQASEPVDVSHPQDADGGDAPIPVDAASDGPKPNGQRCTQNAMCISNHCVDDVCCNDACQGQCMACDVGSAVGTCTPVTGDPHSNRGRCAGTGRCAGACTGAPSGTCTFPSGTVSCAAPSCSVATFTPGSACNGAGACTMPAPVSCGAFRCNAGGDACLIACASDNDCVQPSAPYCVQQACLATKPNATRCTANGECQSTHCVDGVCCDSACQGRCQACDLNSHEGTCMLVTSGQPRGNRPVCGGAAECAGFCGGAPSGECTFPDKSTSCQCPAALLGLGACDSAGACHVLGLGGALGQLCL